MTCPAVTLRPGCVLAVVCSLWILLNPPGQLLAGTEAVMRQDDASGARPEPAGDTGESDGDRRSPASAPAGSRLDSRQLTLGGMFMGNIHLPATRPLPNAAPTHEEMKAATTPPEFRTPPAVSFGWSWRGRGR
ncbi:MAG: hypothetical protein OXF27_18740 [Acidobacteria bacterium]|nr:hypothetical protein [Acidobacteriota bacterium]